MRELTEFQKKVKECRGFLRDAAVGPTRAAMIIVPICENWDEYREEAGIDLAHKWVYQTFGETLKYFKDRYRAVQTLGKDVASKVTHDAAVWLDNTFGKTAHVKDLVDAIMVFYATGGARRKNHPTFRVLKKAPLANHLKTYAWARPLLPDSRPTKNICPTCERRYQDAADLKKSVAELTQERDGLKTIVAELTRERDVLAELLKRREAAPSSPGVAKTKKTMVEQVFGAEFGSGKKGKRGLS